MRILNTHFSYLVKVALLCFSILLISTQLQAREVTFTWSGQNTAPVTGYKLYYKTGTVNDAPYNGTGLSIKNSFTVSISPIILGNSILGITLEGLSPNESYCFALTAYNDTGESGFAKISPVPPLSFASPTINIMSHN